MPPSTQSGWSRVRGVASVLGVVALGLVGVAFAMMFWALAHGVHCPDCDRHKLGAAGVVWWEGWFFWKDRAVLCGAGLALLALPFARRRRHAVIALAGALLFTVFLTFR